jgi:Lon protease-like protein
MQIGTARYVKESDFPSVLPVFPLAGALLLPDGHLPLNIFEPRYMQMFDEALGGHRLIGMVQPALGVEESNHPELSNIGCIGRITSFSETPDGRYAIGLTGVARFRLLEECAAHKPFRTVKFAPFMSDLSADETEEQVNRANLLQVFRDFLEANQLEADWASVERASNRVLVNSLSMMSPFGPAEKQALLEAQDLKSRAETLIAITEVVLAQASTDASRTLQ